MRWLLLLGLLWTPPVWADGGRAPQIFINGAAGAWGFDNTFLGLMGNRGANATIAAAVTLQFNNTATSAPIYATQTVICVAYTWARL